MKSLKKNSGILKIIAKADPKTNANKGEPINIEPNAMQAPIKNFMTFVL